MRRILLLILALLLLAGCANEPEPTLMPTEPPVPWVYAVGEEWDAEGVLLEIPLNIPDAMKYSLYAGPQVLEDALYLCDRTAGRTPCIPRTGGLT